PEVHARGPDTGIQADRRGVGEAHLPGGVLVALRGAAPDVVGNRGDLPGERRPAILGGSGEGHDGKHDGERKGELEALHPGSPGGWGARGRSRASVTLYG